MTAAAGTTATVDSGAAISAADASAIATANNVTAAFSTGISRFSCQLIKWWLKMRSTELGNADGDDADVNITITDDSTSITATKLSLITAATTGTVTLSNSHTITGDGAALKAALETDAVTAAAGTTATVSGAVTVSVANSIAGANNVQASFTNGITDSLANLLNQEEMLPED